MIREGGSLPRARLEHGFRLALSREPRPREVAVLLGILTKHHEQYKKDRAAALALLAEGDAPAAADLDPVELAAWTDVARVLLNLEETITRS
jgi:hypothetical protein